MIFKKSILAAVMLLSCIPAHAETRSFNINSIHSIDIGIGLSLFFTQGPLKKMEISANDDAFEFIKCTNNQGILTIQYVPSYNASNSDVSIYIQAPDIVYFRASTGSKITLRNDFECKDKLTLVANVGSSITAGNIRAKSTEAHIYTGSNLTVSNFNTNNLEIKMSAGDNVNINNVFAERLSINNGTGGSVWIGDFNGSVLHATSGAGSTFKFDNITSNKTNLQLLTSASMFISNINTDNIHANMQTSSTLDITGICNTANLSLSDKVTTTLNIANLSGKKHVNYWQSRFNLPNSSKGKIIIDGKEYSGRYNSSEYSQPNYMNSQSDFVNGLQQDSSKGSKRKFIINGKEYPDRSGNSKPDSKKKKKKTREDYRLKDLNP